MSTQTSTAKAVAAQAVGLDRIMVALDASGHADRALDEAIRLSDTPAGKITGIHAYAARMHDMRFRQMEGGLPERYLEEEEMLHQRDVHDDLITQGLSIISDSYHDAAEVACEKANRPYARLSPEGKNYRRILGELEKGGFDLLVLGALGLGAVPGSLIGTVCERVARRSPVDTLVIRAADAAIGDGPIVVGIDGSERSFGALKTAFAIARRISCEIHAIAAYDPYYHYVAFNKIAGVLSEEAGKVFRFKEQEALHEELIDEGIAKIYASHLEVARSIADDEGVEIVTKLLDGKPFKAMRDYLVEVGASLLIVGKTGVHADTSLDIGGNTENLLRSSPCHIWLGQVEFTPPLDVIAEETISWSTEAEDFLSRAPEFVQGMARKAVHRFANERGHTFITRDIVEEGANSMMPGRQKPAESDMEWSPEASEILKGAEADESIRLSAEKKARREGADIVQPGHVTPFLETGEGLSWAAAGLARLSRVPEGMRQAAQARIENMARAQGAEEVSLEMVEEGLAEGRKAMGAAMGKPKEIAPEKGEFVCPFGEKAKAGFKWSQEAEIRMEKIPEGFMRDMTRQRIEAFAERTKVKDITLQLVEEKYAEWMAGFSKQAETMPWDEAAAERVKRIPDFVRGMVMLEVERQARDLGLDRVTGDAIDAASAKWEASGMFHGKED